MDRNEFLMNIDLLIASYKEREILKLYWFNMWKRHKSEIENRKTDRHNFS